ARAISSFRPHILVGKSQGGPTILQLIHRGYWKGPSLICCGAVVPGLDDCSLPDKVPFLLCYGSKDIAVPLSVAEHILEVNKHLGENIKLVVVEDDHSLAGLVNDENDPNLFSLIRQLWRMRLTVEGFDQE